jgi:RNA polymerase sigma-70 factor (ECF subfamily)
MIATEAFEHFMRDHQSLVYTLAWRMLNNEAEAQDISQEVFLRAYRHFNELQSRATPTAWLRVVTRNLCLNHLVRYRYRWRFFSELHREQPDGSEAPEWTIADVRETDVTAFDQRQLVEQALSGLPSAQRVALVLYHFENLNFGQIAARLRISLSKVKMDIFRGRAALRRWLRGQQKREAWAVHRRPSEMAGLSSAFGRGLLLCPGH